MTFIEKLEEFGYKKYPFLPDRYFKTYLDLNGISVIIILIDEEIEDAGIGSYGVLNNYDTFASRLNQADINDMQIAYNRVQKDVKELDKWLKMKLKLTK